MPISSASVSMLIFDFTRALNAVKPVAILVKAFPAPITESIPFSVALGLNALPNTAPNTPPGAAASPPACANAALIPDKTVVNCKLSSCVHSNF